LPNNSAAIVLQGVSKRFTLRRNQAGSVKERALALVHRSRREVHEDFWALRNVSFTVRAGEAVACVGRNGSGKSTLLKLVAGILAPTWGSVQLRRAARVGTLIELGIGFHPELSGIENVYLNAAVHGLTRQEIDGIYPEVVEYSGLSHFMDQPVKTFSSGMHMRLGFAVAMALKPDVLLLDEVFAVGDADFQQRCLQTMRDFRARGGTLLFVSHSPEAVRQICDRAIVFESGAIAFDGSVDDGLRRYASLAAEHSDALPGSEMRTAPEPWHHAAMGGRWEALGDWALSMLEREGLTPSSFVLDMGCGSLPVARRLLPRMEQGRYWGFDPSRELFNAGVLHELAPRQVDATRGHFVINDRFDLAECPHTFDFAICHSLLTRLLGDQIGACLVAATGHLKSGGRLLVAVGPPALYGSQSPLEMLVRRHADTIGVRVEPRPEAGHPRGETVLALVKP
jgi:ABC-type polysaccharide/polyol phosphate transport system ATPase subunit